MKSSGVLPDSHMKQTSSRDAFAMRQLEYVLSALVHNNDRQHHSEIGCACSVARIPREQQAQVRACNCAVSDTSQAMFRHHHIQADQNHAYLVLLI